MATTSVQLPLPLAFGPTTLTAIIAWAGGETPDTSEGVLVDVTGRGASGAHGTTSGGVGGGGGAFARSFLDVGIWADTQIIVASGSVFGSVFSLNGTGLQSDDTGEWLVMANDASGATAGSDAESLGDSVFPGGNGGTVAFTGGGGGGGAGTITKAGSDGDSSFGASGGAGGLDGDNQPSGGNGGSGGGTPVAAEDGLTPGGGGGGGYGSGGGGAAGGSGGDGRVIITYTVLASGDSAGLLLMGVGS